eukprot:7388023-Prymnesium_polylepis.2
MWSSIIYVDCCCSSRLYATSLCNVLAAASASMPQTAAQSRTPLEGRDELCVALLEVPKRLPHHLLHRSLRSTELRPQVRDGLGASAVEAEANELLEHAARDLEREGRVAASAQHRRLLGWREAHFGAQELGRVLLTQGPDRVLD